MLPMEAALSKELAEEFKGLVDQAMRVAFNIFANREVERDLEAPVWSKMPFGELSFATLSHTKTARICASLRTLEQAGYMGEHAALVTLAAGRAPTGDDRGLTRRVISIDEKIDDELLDTINYCAFHWAYRRMLEHHTNVAKAPTENQGA